MESAEFDKLTRLVERQTNVEERVPAFYIRTLLSLEASLNAALAKEKESKEKDAKKKLNTANSKALNTMKQRVRKANKEYEKEIQLLQQVCLRNCIYILVTKLTFNRTRRSSRRSTGYRKLFRSSQLRKRRKHRSTTRPLKVKRVTMISPQLARAERLCSSQRKASSRTCRQFQKLGVER